jgi:hypothetical protein
MTIKAAEASIEIAEYNYVTFTGTPEAVVFGKSPVE